MNIGQLIRGLVGDLQVSDPKSLELKVGQVVRGVILQMMSEQDALVNIAGVQVRARLETPLAQGQSTLLQVQPESVSGQVVLKPLASSGVQIAEQSLPDLLKDFGMKDTAANRRVLQELHQGQAPLVKESVQAYAGATARIPEGADEAQWKQAALLAVKRGLPVTAETVGALHRTLFGKPMDQSLQSFGNLVRQALGAEGGQTAFTASAPVRALLVQVGQLLEVLPQGPEAKPAAADVPRAAGMPPAPGEGAAGGASARGGTAEARASAGAQQAQAAPAAAPAGEGAAAARGAGGAELAEPAAAAGAPGRSAAALEAARQPQPQQGLGGAAAAPAREEPAPWVGQLLKALGVEHEQQLARPHERGGGILQPPPPGLADDAPAPSAGAPQAAAVDAAGGSDTLKGLLLQLSSSDDAPAAIREGAQQLVQQITGQQLLLTPDRSSMFAHMTLMLPLLNGDGQQTAAIHIQSRKGQRGELDATNCRLLFDLNMRSLGNTLVDVQVTERIVSLRIHNDFPAIGELLEQHRDEIKAGLEKIGYQFLSMKTLPYPVPQTANGETGGGLGPQGNASPAFQAAGMYHAKPYKGVDLRV